MNINDIKNKIRERYPDLNIWDKEGYPDSLLIEPAYIIEISQFLKENSELAFDFLICCLAVDYPSSEYGDARISGEHEISESLNHIEMIYLFHSYKHNHQIRIRTTLPRNEPSIDSVSSVFPTALWHEREIFDLFGVKFLDHPDLRRILLPEDWEGFPMRKDYEHENLIRRPEGN